MTSIARIYGVYASLLVLSCCDSASPMTDAPRPPQAQESRPHVTRLSVVTGDRQSAYIQDVLPEPLVIRLVDEGNTPVENAAIKVQVRRGGGSIDHPSVHTDSDGQAEVRWTVGPDYTNTLEARFAGSEDYLPSSVAVYATSKYLYQRPAVLDDGWRVASLHDEGLDVSRMERLIDAIRAGEYARIHSVQIVKHGRLVLDAYFPQTMIAAGYEWLNREDGLHYQASVTKSITSALMGVAVDKGMVESVDQKLFSFFPEYESFENWDDRKNDITLSDALTMRPGYVCNDGDGFTKLRRSSDWIKYMLDLPMAHDPGTHFSYCTGTTIVLGAVIAKASGMPIPAFAERYLFGPLGITDVEWLYTPGGRAATGYGLFMKPRDMAKFGYLFLTGGVWENVQLLSEDWIEESTRTHVSSPLHGYQWWIRHFNVGGSSTRAYYANGNGGQYIYVFPALDMVVVTTAGNYDSDLNNQTHEILRRFILPGVGDMSGNPSRR